MGKIIEWTENLKTGDHLIDLDHQTLFDLINLLDETGSNQGKDRVRMVLGILNNYTIQHFGREESLMDRFKYPDRFYHKKQHKSMIDAQNELIGEFLADPTKIKPEDVLHFIKKWFIGHIIRTDKKLADYLRDVGGDDNLIPSQQKDAAEAPLPENPEEFLGRVRKAITQDKTKRALIERIIGADPSS